MRALIYNVLDATAGGLCDVLSVADWLKYPPISVVGDLSRSLSGLGRGM